MGAERPRPEAGVFKEHNAAVAVGFFAFLLPLFRNLNGGAKDSWLDDGAVVAPIRHHDSQRLRIALLTHQVNAGLPNLDFPLGP